MTFNRDNADKMEEEQRNHTRQRVRAVRIGGCSFSNVREIIQDDVAWGLDRA